MGFGYAIFVMSQHEIRLLRPVAPAAARLRRVQALSRCIYLTLPALTVLVMLIVQIFAFYDVPFYGDVMDLSSPLYELHTFPISWDIPCCDEMLDFLGYAVLVYGIGTFADVPEWRKANMNAS